MQMPIPVLIFPCPSPWGWTIKALQSLTLRWPLDPPPPKGDYYPRMPWRCAMCGSRLRLASEKRKLLEPPSTRSDNRNGMNKPPKEKKRSTSPEEFARTRPDVSWWRRGLGSRRSIIMSEGPLELVPIPSPIPWDGVNMSGPQRTSTKVPNGLGIYGAPAPWTTSNWLWGWSAQGPLLRLTSGPGKMFTFSHLHPTS